MQPGTSASVLRLDTSAIRRRPDTVRVSEVSSRPTHRGKIRRDVASPTPPPFAPPAASTASPTPSATSSPRRKKVEQTGTRVRYLNIGDPNQFGFRDAAASDRGGRARHARRAQRLHARRPGILEAREAVAADFAARGVPVSPDRVLITSGTSEGLELALTAIVDEGEAVLVPSPTYPLYTAVLAKIGAEPQYYRTDPDERLAAGSR